ncbi:hypothetical protein M7I_5993 [Glarea lozoyensis 74030]|uniref:Uncharacterized protein n=1 Tax=Glarea lozoyensis (strain ATCC 74030 / MF5533) TaxID=1104152 RepID=H0ETD1_GLAL7|nr:hypothetical protein M7I_5993 [Glarea lozoyensis 74030]
MNRKERVKRNGAGASQISDRPKFSYPKLEYDARIRLDKKTQDMQTRRMTSQL